MRAVNLIVEVIQRLHGVQASVIALLDSHWLLTTQPAQRRDILTVCMRWVDQCSYGLLCDKNMQCNRRYTSTLIPGRFKHNIEAYMQLME